MLKPTAPLLKGGKSSSREWLARHFRDPYVKKRLQFPSAYRSRAAFKLLDIDGRFGFLDHPSTRVVVDLGAAPGGWSQVVAGKFGFREWASEDCAPKPRTFTPSAMKKTEREWSEAVPQAIPAGKIKRARDGVILPVPVRTIIAVDILPMSPIRGVRIIRQNFLQPETDEMIAALLPPDRPKVDVVLSDIAVNTSGIKTQDEAVSANVMKSVFRFVRQHLRIPGGEEESGGWLVVKHFAGPECDEFKRTILAPSFDSVTYVKPPASRSESSEGYFVCKGFRGAQEDVPVVTPT